VKSNRVFSLITRGRVKAARISSLIDRNALLLLGFVLVVVAISRVVGTYNDPPWWMCSDFFCDEGWWADSARGKVLFDDYFADDFGISYLFAPGYTFLLQGVYRLFGVGLLQTRMVSAVGAVLTIIVMCGTIWRLLGRRQALLCALLLGASPFYWAYNRVALTETLQALFITGAFCLYMLKKNDRVAPFLAGLLLSMSVGIKLNAAAIGVIPLFLASCAEAISQARQGESSVGTWVHLRPVFMGFLGVLAGVTAFLIVTVIPNWQAFLSIVFSEGGLGDFPVTRLLALFGPSLVSIANATDPPMVLLWRVAAWSPVVCLGAWLCLVRLAGRHAGRDPSTRPVLSPFEVSVVVWMLSTWFLISLFSNQPDRRFVLLLPPMALAATVFVFSGPGLPNSSFPPTPKPGNRRSFSHFLLWLLIMLPALLVIKPLVTNAILQGTAGLSVGRQPGLSYHLAGAIITFLWLLVLIPLSRFRVTGWKIQHALASKAFVAMLLLLLPYEMTVIGTQMIRGKNTFLETQLALQAIVAEDETVLGHAAAAAFLPHRVRTVRRSTPVDGTPSPNPDVWDRTKPRYIIERETFDYHKLASKYDDLIRGKGYSLVSRFHIGPERDNRSRFVLALYERGQGETSGDTTRAPMHGSPQPLLLHGDSK